MQEKDPNLGECFVCGGEVFLKHLDLKDYFLTQKNFSLYRCCSCGLLYTWPCPDSENLSSYYDSEEYTSHNSKKFSLKNTFYKLARQWALNKKFKMINKHVSKGNLLDIGSGTGEFLDHCKSKGWSVFGIEPNVKARENAINDFGLEIKDRTALKDLTKKSFDVITMWHVLEHIDDPLAQIELNHELLKPGGLMMLALPNYESWDANHYAKFWAAYDVPRHLYHFNREAIKRLANKAGFDIVDMQPLKLDAYYICLLSEKYINGKMNYFKAVLNGWRSNNAAKKNKFGYSSWVFILRRR